VSQECNTKILDAVKGIQEKVNTADKNMKEMTKTLNDAEKKRVEADAKVDKPSAPANQAQINSASANSVPRPMANQPSALIDLSK